MCTHSMEVCDRCGREVPAVWQHREYGESFTHREIEWMCADCHPSRAETTVEPDTGVGPT